MRHLIIGAGASLAESLEAGSTAENGMPLLHNFAKKTWQNYTPHPLLEEYLKSIGCSELGRDPREKFYELEEEGLTNIEKFFEFAWVNKDTKYKINTEHLPPGYISGLRIKTPEANSSQSSPEANDSFWQNMLYHGIGSPISFQMIKLFHVNGKGWVDLKVSKKVANNLNNNDLILNLNYDTIFELALQQAEFEFHYFSNQTTSGFTICKPHGSLNMVANKTEFRFYKPSWLGMPQPQGFQSYSGLIPPRLNKSYAQHPIAKTLISSVYNRKPDVITFWGVGLTESDVDLLALYKQWVSHSKCVEVINPNKEVSKRINELLNVESIQYDSVDQWVKTTN